MPVNLFLALLLKANVYECLDWITEQCRVVRLVFFSPRAHLDSFYSFSVHPAGYFFCCQVKTIVLMTDRRPAREQLLGLFLPRAAAFQSGAQLRRWRTIRLDEPTKEDREAKKLCVYIHAARTLVKPSGFSSNPIVSVWATCCTFKMIWTNLVDCNKTPELWGRRNQKAVFRLRH